MVGNIGQTIKMITNVELTLAIADRALKTLTAAGISTTKLDCFMDIRYVNEVCPLRLCEMLDADDFNFAHDIFGIYSHFNRETKRLENGFLPRFSV
jgi:hypothetical protein